MVNIFDLTLLLIYLLVGLISYNFTNKLLKYYFNKKSNILFEKTFINNLKKLNKYKTTDKYDIIRVIFYNYDNDLIINMNEFEFIEETGEEWFLSLLVKYGKEDKTKLDENGYIIYKTDEDYNVFKSLIKTIQYNKLILYNNVNINILYELGDKLCIPKKSLDIIKKNKLVEFEINHLNKLFTKKELNYLRMSFKCKLCKQGFTHFNNKEGSCKYHPSSYNINSGLYNCCGKTINSEPCLNGKHVAEFFTNELELIKTLMNNI
jgi:hypothetical protein